MYLSSVLYVRAYYLPISFVLRPSEAKKRLTFYVRGPVRD